MLKHTESLGHHLVMAECVEVMVSEPMRVFFVGLERHQIDDIDHPDFEIRQVVPKKIDRGQRLQCPRRQVAAAFLPHRLAAMQQ